MVLVESRVVLELLRTTSTREHFASVSSVSALHGMAWSVVPIPGNPPSVSTAYAMRPLRTSQHDVGNLANVFAVRSHHLVSFQRIRCHSTRTPDFHRLRTPTISAPVPDGLLFGSSMFMVLSLFRLNTFAHPPFPKCVFSSQSTGKATSRIFLNVSSRCRTRCRGKRSGARAPYAKSCRELEIRVLRCRRASVPRLSEFSRACRMRAQNHLL
jgi:hypothetical protein